MDINKYAKELGRKGGNATKKKHGEDHFKRISKLASIARQKKREERENSI